MLSRLSHPRFLTAAELAVLPLLFGSTVVLAKLALVDLGPVTLAALRFALAALILLPLAVRRAPVRLWPRSVWIRLAAMGITFYVMGNGSLFLGLKLVPATTAALLLSLTPLVVLILGIPWLHEVPTPLQLGAVLGCIAGSVLFFARGIDAGQPLGIGIISGGLVCSAAFTLLARGLARENSIDTLSLTAIPIAIGAALLLAIAAVMEGAPHLSPADWGIVVVLAAFNTVGAPLLYTHALRSLTALELTAVLNLNPFVTAILAWVFLGNRLSPFQLGAMLVVVLSVFTLQLDRLRRDAASGGS